MHKNPRIGSYEYYERLYEVEEKHWWYIGIHEVAARILNSHYRGMKNLSILDARCGTGFTLTWLERYTLPKQAVGIDLSWHAFQFCRRREQRLLSQASVMELSFKNGLFDLVVCKAVIQHLPRKGSDKTALREFYGVLKPGGCLLLLTNSSQGIGKGAKSVDEKYRMYSPDEVRDKVLEAGFHTLKLTCANALMSVIPTIRRYLKHRKNQVYHRQGLPNRRP
ncbi:MAG: hypothetical protein C4291_04160 [Candidatus Dadabacteria bacterium]